MAKKREEAKWVQLGLRVTPEQHEEIARAVERVNENCDTPTSQNSFCIRAALAAARQVMKKAEQN